MARRSRRRRKGLVAFLFPELHRSWRKAKYHMHPGRVLGRALSWPEVKAGLRSTFGTRTVKVTAKTRQKQVAGVQRKETAAKNKATRVIKPRPVGKSGQTNYRRKKDGTFNGREAMAPHERGAYERAYGRTVDPSLAPRSARTRRTPGT